MTGYKQQQFLATQAGDQACAVLVWYTGTAAATITVSDVPLFTFQVGGVDDATVNPLGVTPGRITDAEAATLGALVDLINATSNTSHWHASLCAAFRDGDTTDVKPITIIAVDRTGITGATGAVLGGIGWDFEEADATPFDVQVMCFGRESDTDIIDCGARQQASNTRKTRDKADANFGESLIPSDMIARLFRLVFTLGNASGAGGITVNVYAALQSTASAAAARLLYSYTATEDTQAELLFDPPVDLQTRAGERIVIGLVVGTTELDNMTVFGVGGYGPAGNLISQ